MSTSNTKRSSTSPGAFPSKKRLKARVGKRAIVKNETATEFTAVSVKVSNQRVVSIQSLQSLLNKTSHPSAPVRKSALLGMMQQELLKESLSSLWMPVVCKCACTDADASVRSVGYQVLQQQASSLPKHHLPIVMAFVSSAMVDLDVSKRFHGCKVLSLIANNSNTTTMPNVKQDLLPVFPRLLRDTSSVKSDYSSNYGLQEKSSKSKKKSEDRLSIVVEALLAFLRVSFTKENDNTIVFRQSPDLNFRVDSCNGIFVAPPRTLVPATSIKSMSDFATLMRDSSQIQQESIPLQQECLSILERLLELLIELQQRSNQSGWNSQSLPQLLLVLESVRILWQQLSRYKKPPQQQLGMRFLKLLLEFFPVSQHRDESSLALQANTLLVCVVIEVGRDVDDNASKIQWMHPVVSFCCQEQKENSSGLVMDAIEILLSDWEPNHDGKTNRFGQKVFQSLCSTYFSMANITEDMNSSLAGRKAVRLVLKLIKRYDDSKQQDDDSQSKTKKQFVTLIQQVVGCLPSYLVAWDDLHLQDSIAVWSFLLNTILRQDDISTGDKQKTSSVVVTDELLTSLSEGIGRCLFDRTRKEKKQAKQPLRFLLYPEHIQRLVVGFIARVIQSSPQGQKTMVQGLSKACQHVTNPVADYIFDVMHTIRRSMSMQSYLEFVIDSMGSIGEEASTTKKQGKKACGSDSVLENDQDSPTDPISFVALTKSEEALKRVCRALCGCGSVSKILTALEPVLSNWIQMGESERSDVAFQSLSLEGIQSKRAVLIILARLSLELKDEGNSSAFTIIPHLFGPVKTATCELLPYFLLANEDLKNAGHESFGSLLRPIMVLITCEPRLLSAIFQEAVDRIVGFDCESSSLGQESNPHLLQSPDSLLLQSLVELIQSPKLASLVREQSEQLRKCCRMIEDHVTKACSGSQNDQLGGALRTRLDLIVGFAPQK